MENAVSYRLRPAPSTPPPVVSNSHFCTHRASRDAFGASRRDNPGAYAPQSATPRYIPPYLAKSRLCPDGFPPSPRRHRTTCPSGRESRPFWHTKSLGCVVEQTRFKWCDRDKGRASLFHAGLSAKNRSVRKDCPDQEAAEVSGAHAAIVTFCLRRIPAPG